MKLLLTELENATGTASLEQMMGKTSSILSLFEVLVRCFYSNAGWTVR